MSSSKHDVELSKEYSCIFITHCQKENMGDIIFPCL